MMRKGVFRLSIFFLIVVRVLLCFLGSGPLECGECLFVLISMLKFEDQRSDSEPYLCFVPAKSDDQ